MCLSISPQSRLADTLDITFLIMSETAQGGPCRVDSSRAVGSLGGHRFCTECSCRSVRGGWSAPKNGTTWRPESAFFWQGLFKADGGFHQNPSGPKERMIYLYTLFNRQKISQKCGHLDPVSGVSILLARILISCGSSKKDTVVSPISFLL